jgi:putative effector of murein hydrolase
MPLYQPLFAVALTVGVWVLASRASHRAPSALNPVLTSALVIIGVLVVTDLPVEQYTRAATPITVLLSPAIVALAIPIQRNARKLLRLLPTILIASIVASVAGIAVTVLTATALGAPASLVATLAPKHATSAVAATTAETLGGSPSLAAVFAVMTGVLGAVAGPPLLRLFRVRSAASRGLAMGLSAHAIGTSRAFDISGEDGASSAFGMALAALIVPLVAAGFAAVGWLPTSILR